VASLKVLLAMLLRCVGAADWRCRAVRPIRWLLFYPVHPGPLQFARVSL